ncbi:MAG TPA: nitroreductase family protein [Firmicutes bacterium]|mgnify:CR=1 FL=1|nr:nitroreductase family protein [Bacillota bacterium]
MADSTDFATTSEILEHLKTRRLRRAYLRDEKPPRLTIRQILNAAASAPFQSHDDLPPWRFIATDDASMIASIARAVDPSDSGEPDYATPDSIGYNPKTYFKNAPWVVVMLVKMPDAETAPEESRETIAYDMVVSYGAALGMLMAAAHIAGLACGWVGSFTASPSCRVDSLEKLLGVKVPWRAYCIIPIGYTAEKGKIRERNYEEMVEFR